MSSSESSRRFQFIREIASGGFGSVYLAKVIHADGFSRLQAVKLLHPRWSENEEIAARMRDEARLLGWLRHKNIVDVMDLTLIDGRCAVLMEYLEAVDVKVVINHCADTGSRIPLRAALEVSAAVASALDAAYNRPPYAGEKPLRVIHRDIKPSNIMIDEGGGVKVLDFGVARAEFDERESKTQELAFGSLEYMPPERLFFEPESPASDVYSLGATLYEMLALEKFGKAKLRPKEHEQYFEDRFDFLLERFPLNQEAEDLLHDLLMGMLSFDEPERPTAADAVNRMRAFARRLQEHPLEEWAEHVVPPLLKVSRGREDTKSPGSLVGSVLTEDARALDQRSIWDENTGMSTRAMDLAGLDDEMTGSLADDARWKALKQATIEEMAKKGELGPARRPPEPPVGEMSLPRSKRPPPPPLPTPTPTPAPTPRVASPPVDDLDEGMEETTRARRPDLAQAARLTPAATPPPEAPAPSAPRADRPPKKPVTRSVPPPSELPGRVSAPVKVASSAPAKPRKRKRGGLALTMVMMFGVGVAGALILLAVVMLVGVLAVIAMPGAGRTPEPTVVVTPPPAPPAPPPVPVEITGPHASFVSGRSNTERMKVGCDVGSAEGVDRVDIPGDVLGDCLVQAITGDGGRLRFKVEKAEPREYLCFVGDSKECR